MGAVRVHARQPEGTVPRAVAALVGLSALVQRGARHRHKSHRACVSGRRMRRLATGGSIDRSRPMPFTFDGQALTGFAGDTLASALLANGVRIVGYSAELGRPRGVFAAGVEEPNAFVRVRTGELVEPLARATQVLLAPDLEAWSTRGKAHLTDATESRRF